jgi:hypothetical protein
MPLQQVLLLAMTRMRSEICVAGFSTEPDPLTGLRWIRPVRDHDTVQPGDMCDKDGCVFHCGDVIELHLIKPRPEPPHVEDWLTDFVHHRPRRLRRLEGDKRAQFLAKYLDPAPQDVLSRCSRSLCLVKPRRTWAHFFLDAYSGKYAARMGFELELDDKGHSSSHSVWHTEQRGISVTDLKWRALGRKWLTDCGERLDLGPQELFERLKAKELYLTVGLSRAWKGKCWPLVVGVHAVPDYTM